MAKAKPDAASQYDARYEILRLRGYLATLSTESLCRYMQRLSTIQDGALVMSQLGLQSPYRETSYAVALAATTPEPTEPAALDEKRLALLLEAVHNRYGKRYFQINAAEKRETMQVALGGFAKRFFAGPFLNVPQVRARVRDYLYPFDDTLAEETGFSATGAMSVVEAIALRLQANLDKLNRMFAFATSPILSPAGQAREQRKADAAFESDIREVVIADLEAELGFDLVRRFLNTFGLRRGEIEGFFWFDDQPQPFEERPVVILHGRSICIPIVNQLFLAVWAWGVRSLMSSERRERFLQHRGKQLERDAVAALARLVPDAMIYAPVYESPGTDEHDALALLGDTAIIVEAKGGKPPRALRDVEMALKFIERQFSSEMGIQKGYDQGNTLARRLVNATEPIVLYDEDKNPAVTILPKEVRNAYVVIVTLDEFGMLATDLTTLLKKAEEDPYPWAVNIYDLELFADVFVEKRKWDSKTFIRWLDERREAMRQHRFATDDELEIAGVFVTHGSLNAFPQDAVVLGLRRYSNVFEDFSHEKLGDLPVELREPEPADLESMREIGPEEKDRIIAEIVRHARVGRNALCPCGSGRKYKKCHLGA